MGNLIIIISIIFAVLLFQHVKDYIAHRREDELNIKKPVAALKRRKTADITKIPLRLADSVLFNYVGKFDNSKLYKTGEIVMINGAFYCNNNGDWIQIDAY